MTRKRLQYQQYTTGFPPFIQPMGWLGAFSEPVRKVAKAAIIGTTVAAFVPLPAPTPSVAWASKFEAPRQKPRQFVGFNPFVASPFFQPFGWFEAFNESTRPNNKIYDEGGWNQEEPIAPEPTFYGWQSEFGQPRAKLLRFEAFTPVPTPSVIQPFGWYAQYPLPYRLKFNIPAFQNDWLVEPTIVPLPPLDPFVETYQEYLLRKKLEKRVHKEEKTRLQEEIEWEQQRRLDIAKALYTPLVEFTWTGRPAITVATPQTADLTVAITEARQKIETDKKAKQDADDDDYYDYTLLDL